MDFTVQLNSYEFEMRSLFSLINLNPISCENDYIDFLLYILKKINECQIRKV